MGPAEGEIAPIGPALATDLTLLPLLHERKIRMIYVKFYVTS